MMTADRRGVDGPVRIDELERGHRLVDVGVSDNANAAAVGILVDDVMVERGVVRHHEKPPRLPGARPGRLITT
jgi:hypothetical protein